MDKDNNRSKWGRDKVSRHGKVTERKDKKNLFGFPNEKSYRNHKDEYFPEVIAKKKAFKNLKTQLKKLDF